MSSRIGISLGDVTGIGPEVILKALAAEAQADDSHYLLIGDFQLLDRLNRQFGLQLPLQMAEKNSGRFLVQNPLTGALPANLQPGSPVAAQAAVAWLKDGAQRCLRRELDALITAPVNKESIIDSGERSFIGQTEFLSQLAGTTHTGMMLMGQDDRGRWLRVVLATTHVPLRLVAEQLTQAKVELAIELAAKACADLDLPKARVAVCGLNPHAGEGGKMGTEEITTIAPAVEAARRKKLNVSGPFAADALFYSVFKGDYEIVVAMYHDQGLAPLKMIGFESGINWTLGLPFIRTSPDHGTAYNIAGKGIANPSSMRAAIQLARQLAAKRARS
ncbi:MAG TPA: 4-hydroxythreonine-4-phosphate dehydrogenase PdxA [Verrucomicrobiae bacterium]|jgi:4-hydroxythreonine-4-phosphate dehydrogenase|nr:4-hydroxythreonine-4-phosphate dehydrogenase PdxA [Verrucomicrobiae bacterium]